MPDGRRVALGTAVNIVGRAGDADVRISDPSVSRRHAHIVVEGDGAAVEDLGSKNGTRVGSVLVSQLVRLSNGDIVAFGGVETKLEVQAFDDTATSPL